MSESKEKAKVGTPTVAAHEPFTFAGLVRSEFAQLDKEPVGEDDAVIASGGHADEPWVSFTVSDYFGLALSGGGIRSATFNLGLLQALERKHVLNYVDYLSTVSGGGYIGGFWTTWLKRQRDAAGGAVSEDFEAPCFPLQESDGSKAGPAVAPELREPPEIRHLREFSRFIMPRVGFFHSETWAGIVTILGGMLPALAAALSLLAASLYAWFYPSFLLIRLTERHPLITAGIFTGLTLFVQSYAEYVWRRSGKGGRSTGAAWRYLFFLGIVGVLAFFGWLSWRFAGLGETAPWLEQVGRDYTPEYPAALGFSPLLLSPAFVWTAMALVVLFFRGVASRFGEGRRSISWSSGFDRVTARCLASAIVWCGLALVWGACAWLREDQRPWIQSAPGIGAVGLSALFFWFRDWLTKPIEETRASSLIGRAVERLKPLFPQLLAYAAVVSLAIAAGLIVQRWGLGKHILIGLGVVTVNLLGTLYFFDPARVGMHDFYRARICRCFLGATLAARQGGWKVGARPTSEQPGDDITFGELRGGTRPIHLVCCAANNLSGDVLSSLYRGARSAVISPFGIALGDHVNRIDHLRLSSALTASAAAFNSQMGRISMHLGSAVAFLMSALNLRLGLWVQHPLAIDRRRGHFPGLPFFYEMLGRSNCDPVGGTDPSVDPSADLEKTRSRSWARRILGALNKTLEKTSRTAHQAVLRVQKNNAFLHLSDGNHFENLGLYELVRRHCRYVIVSDCGADPEVAFDDLANTLRRIREDFGVEIELDVTSLSPDEKGHSRQHAVIGSIHYDGLGGTDKGTILYFKPTLTGDEPPDVLQYRTRNGSFPHEGTGDQFYDEAQWESYRRLGEHAVSSTLRFLEKKDPTKRAPERFIENLFLEASQQWRPSPGLQRDVFRELNERCASLEADVRDNASPTLRAEFFPEVVAALATKDGGVAGGVGSTEEELRTVYFLMVIAQIMEDAWVAAELEDYWAHPLNEGWMNYFQRWASTPSFRRWWPILRPLYSPGFRDFVRDRFDIRIRSADARPHEATGPGARLHLCFPETGSIVQDGFAWKQWIARFGEPALNEFKAIDYCLELEGDGPGDTLQTIQVGFVLYRQDANTKVISWHCRHLYVPHSLIGAGIVARFLDALIRYFKKAGAVDRPREIRVTIDDVITGEPAYRASQSERRDPATRMARVHTINFYKSRGFLYATGKDRPSSEMVLPLE